MWYIPTVKHYSAFKREEILPYPTTWVKLEDIMFSEISQLQRNQYCVIPLCEASLVKLLKAEGQMVVVSNCGEEEMGRFF